MTAVVRTKAELAKALDVNPRTVTNWVDAGCPQIPGGGFVVEHVDIWRRQRQREAAHKTARVTGAANLPSRVWQLRRRRAMALTEELKLVGERRSVVPSAEVKGMLQVRGRALRSRLHASRRRLTRLLQLESTERDAEDVLGRELRDVLGRLVQHAKRQRRARDGSPVADLPADLGVAGDEPDAANFSLDLEDHWQTRFDRAQALRRELSVACLRGQYVAWSEIDARLARAASEFKSRLLALPRRLAPEVAALSDEAEIDALLAREFRSALATYDGEVRP